MDDFGRVPLAAGRRANQVRRHTCIRQGFDTKPCRGCLLRIFRRSEDQDPSRVWAGRGPARRARRQPLCNLDAKLRSNPDWRNIFARRRSL